MRVKYEMRRNYPHMLGEDIPIWVRFIRENPDYFDEVEYDVKVGQGVQLPDDWKEKDRKWAKQLTTKRIDVVGFKDDQIVLVEVKVRAMLNALGQLFGYKFLYERENNLSGKTSLLLVAERIGKDDEDVFDHYGVKISIV